MCDLTNGPTVNAIITHKVLFPTLHGGTGLNQTDVLIALLVVGLLGLSTHLLVAFLEKKGK